MFDEMVSEKAIEWLWILLSAGVVISGLLMLLSGGGFFGFIMVILYVAIGLLAVRVICESMIVAFKMYENNRRSLVVMEQIGKDQSATRQAMQALLAQGTHTPQAAPAPGVTSPTPASTAFGESMKAPGSYDEMMTAGREHFHEKVRTGQSHSKSKIGDWPGGHSVR